VEEALKDVKDAVIANLNAAEVLQPCIGAFDFPASSVAPQFAFVIEATVSNIAAIGCDQFGAAPFQPRTQRIGIVAAICDHAPQVRTRASSPFARHTHRTERAFREAVFGDLRGRELRSDRYSAAVDHHHALRTFPATCFADCGAPFLAVMKVASRNASSQSSSLRSSNCPSNLRHAFSQMPCSSHILNRRQQVDPFGYPSGRSRHRAPVRSTHRMPSRQARLDAQGRPRPSLRRLGSGNNGVNNIHCPSLSNACCFFIQQAQQPNCLMHKSLA
jgi:hypothetical protein